jgi:hypothetical protein
MPNKDSLNSERSFPLSGFGHLLHPANSFRHPSDVLRDTDLTLNEKRAVLAAWASDACAVEASPSLRSAPGATRPVPIDDIFEALCQLDKEARSDASMSWADRQIRRQRIEDLRHRSKKGRARSPRSVEWKFQRRAG